MIAIGSRNQESSELRLCGVLSCIMLQPHPVFETDAPIETSGIFLVVVVLLVAAWPKRCM